jgi:hypothetical protein
MEALSKWICSVHGTTAIPDEIQARAVQCVRYGIDTTSSELRVLA